MYSMMIDIETLDTEETAAIFQVGVIVFDSEYESVVEKLFHISQREVENQIREGRTMSLSTMLFHLETPANVLDTFREGRMFTVGMVDVLRDLKKLIQDYKVGDIWQKGSMDLNVLSHINGGDFWHYRQPRELRTLMRECGVERGDPTHNALEDCRLQISKLKECREVIHDSP